MQLTGAKRLYMMIETYFSPQLIEAMTDKEETVLVKSNLGDSPTVLEMVIFAGILGWFLYLVYSL